MNCKRIERLIPLYVEGDLDSQAASRVEAHTRSCLSCSLIVAEFKESQEWLLSLGVPSLDPEVAARSRRAVLEQVSRQKPESRVAWFVMVRQGGFGALAAGLILAAILVLILLSAPRERTHPELANDSPLSPPEQRATDLAPTHKEGARPVVPEGNRRRSSGSSIRVVSLEQIARSSYESDMPNIEDATQDTPPLSDDPALENEAEMSMQRMSEADPSEQEMLRIEIHTSNPAVHIIWFAPKPSEPGE